jgi:hypothetical protein
MDFADARPAVADSMGPFRKGCGDDLVAVLWGSLRGKRGRSCLRRLKGRELALSLPT